MGLCQSLPKPTTSTPSPGESENDGISNLPNSSPIASRRHTRKPSTYDVKHLTALNDLYSNEPTSSGLPQGIHGLPNLGNTCYFNTTLQLLLSIPSLTDYFLAYNFKKELNPSNFQSSPKNCIALNYGLLVEAVWSKSASKTKIDTSCRRMHAALCSFNSSFKGYGQHDISECLLFVLDGLHEDLNRVTGSKPYVEDVEIESTIGGDESGDGEIGRKAWEGYLRRNKSIIVDLFQGQLRCTLRCQTKGCGREVRRFETFMCLTLPISSKTSPQPLPKTFLNFQSPETLSGDNQWYCSKCKCHVDAIKKIEVWVLPPVLLLSLKRFTSSRRKITTKITYPLHSLHPTPSPPSYDLYSVSRHHGGTGGGHYTNLSRSRIDEEWYELNDSRASRFGGDVVDEDGYVLAYCRMVEEEEGKGSRRDHVRRQSVTMPHLWPEGHSNSKLFKK